MAAAKREVERRKHLVKISIDKSPSCDEALCIHDVGKIGGRRVFELELLADILDRGCKVCAKPPAIENIANQSCDLKMEEEKKEWGSTQHQAVPIGASYDMGWQKGGKGKNSLTGTENNFKKLSAVS